VIEFPTDWRQHFGANLVTAYPPAGGGRFRYHERLRPQPTFSTIVSSLLASDPDFRVHAVGEMLRVVTVEGEYGAWVKLQGVREGSRAERYVGAVFMGDFATALDCIVIVPEAFAELERRSFDLLRHDRFGMTGRPRPFFYVPPVGWHGLPSGLVANWYPLDFPKNQTNIVVQPASFVDGDEAACVDAALEGAKAGLLVDRAARDEFHSSGRVKGHLLRVEGRRPGRTEVVHRELAAFLVPPYLYRMQLETLTAARLLELREIFLGVAGSFHPLPSPDEQRAGRAFGRQAAELFDVWVS
jgi:hypothetical protein